MSKKNIQVLTILVMGIIAGFVGGYLFQQSTKLKKINQVPAQISSEKTPAKNAQGAVEEKGKIFKRPLMEANTTIVPSPSKASSVTKKTSSETVALEKWVGERIITPYFIQDLASFILESYNPPLSIYNSSPQGRLDISLKALNARYGMELIGFKFKGNTLEKARREVLSHLMDPSTLRRQYSYYGKIFIEELIREAKNTTKTFKKDNKTYERPLSKQEIGELLNLLANYVGQLSSLFQVFGKDPFLEKRIGEFLAAEDRSMHCNYVLNQIVNKYRLACEELKTKGQKDSPALEEIKKEREKAIRQYEDAIRERERLRQQIITIVTENKRDIGFSDSDILYICEWIYRRLQQGKSISDILEISYILKDMENKLRAKAREFLS